jgi:DNA-binding GntR family transcriptional regulator
VNQSAQSAARTGAEPVRSAGPGAAAGPVGPVGEPGPGPEPRPAREPSPGPRAVAPGRAVAVDRPRVPVQPTAGDMDRAHDPGPGTAVRATSGPPPEPGAGPVRGPGPGPTWETARETARGRAPRSAQDPVRGLARDPADTVPQGARGEHTHGEPPVPAPRPVVQRSSVRGQILDALRTALAAGDLTPGEVYSAPALGERFGVSATPVREAMQQLALEGAVEVVPNRGFRVVRRGARELAELAEIRALIEVPVLLRLARTVAAERWAELRPAAEETVRAAASGCPAAYGECDRAFHRAVLALSGNEQLVRLAEDLHRRAQWPLTGAPSQHPRTDLLADAAEHTALLDALIARDLDAVRFVLGEHFAGGA